jgi:hypothetical protein
MPGLLANALGIGITSPKFLVNTYTCHEEVQRALWCVPDLQSLLCLPRALFVGPGRQLALCAPITPN